MAYQITWKAMCTEGGEITGAEETEAGSALEALNICRSNMIAKLSGFGLYIVLNINIQRDDGQPVRVELRSIYQFLNSLNAEGGLVKYEEAPQSFTVKFGDDPINN